MSKPEPARKIMFKGELLPYPKVAEQLGLSRSAMRQRLKQYDKGEITEEHLLRFNDKPSDAAPMSKQRGLRLEVQQFFLEKFNSIIKPNLEEELERYLITGEEGPCLRIYHKFQMYLCSRDKATDLDGQKGVMAGPAVIMPSGEQPKKFKKA